MKKNKHLRIVFTRIAASAAILLTLGTVFYTFKDNIFPTKEIIAEAKIVPGDNKAVLYVSSGEKIVLDKNIKAKTINEEGGAKINANKDSLVYSSAGNEAIKAIYNTIVVPKNGEYFLTLADGTKVWLNADTKLKFPVNFVGKSREVQLEGEAYFEVEEDKAMPFIVNTKNSKIKVLGTGFNIKAYSKEEQATTLIHGKVQVIGKNNKQVVLKPGEQAVVANNQINVRKVETSYYTAWKDGYFMFRDASIEEIMTQLSRWYDFEYFYRNKEVANRRITAKVKRFDNFEVVKELLEATRILKLELKGKTVIVKNK